MRAADARSGAARDIDLEALAAWLAGRGEQVTGPLTARRVGLGQSNLTYRIDDARGGSSWVLRRPPHGSLLPTAHDIAREHRILAALAGTQVPVPAVVGLRGEAGVDQLVMEYVDGAVLDSVEIARALPLPVRAGVGPSLARTLAAIHAVDLERTGLHDLASHRPYAERQLKRWSRQWEQSRTRDLPSLDRLTELLRRRVPARHTLCLVHGDLHVRNVICSPSTGAVRAALDWELSTLGDPMADLGTLLAYWPEPGEVPAARPALGVTALPGFTRRDTLIATYAEASGREVGPELGFWHVLAVWKIAIIGEGVLRRARDEPRNAAEGGPPSTAYIDHMVDQAWVLAGHYGLGL
ncbi:phosphotransferase family protein [Streptomyces sp. NBC_01381]|uniref:phosphotransferase family protein n=1 Tax=Streptomyces sp. NBC_01381 TaxID=2903845 RepID=UPI00224F4563|nr:phosphotransferase family protein [Streptomyces sp. NBC_01381]MCX4673131.1 phosphotransferase family protein [Streptomyces sp. NBC_01381]